jgi:crotonobetaine/carnitine-CoA ligase
MTLLESPLTFASVWAATVDRRADSLFLIFEGSDGQVSEWTYGEFDGIVDRAAATLVSNGVEAGSAVHMALANCPAFVAVWLAAIRLGAWVVTSDPMGGRVELQGHIQRTRPAVGVCASERVDVYRSACGSLRVVVIEEQDPAMTVLGDDPVRSWTVPAPTDRAAVMFTSGTTGTPKGVEVTQANYAFAGRIMSAAAGLGETDRQLVVLPLFHANAQYYSFAASIWTGASVALMSSFTASGFLGQAARHRATTASLFAAPMRMILARGGPVDDVLLRQCWFAQNLATEQYQTISNWLGCRPRQLYGMTETIPAVLSCDPDEGEHSSMGRVTAGCLVDVQRPDGTTVEVGEVGEVVVGGDRGTTLFAGYLDDPDTTAASFRNGWFLTGDRATRDVDGRHFFDGRRSDILKVSGENVSVVEVEAVLAGHPAVLEAAVVGRFDEVRDEVPVAFVVADPSVPPPTTAELDTWCAGRLTRAKRPVRITMLDELPRTSVGKIRKFLLQDFNHGGECPR